MLDSAANSVGNIDIISYHLAFPSHMICKYWRSFISGTLYLLVLFGGSDVLSVGFRSWFRRKHRHNFVPFGVSLAYDLQILAIFYLWNTIPFGVFWGSDVLSVGFSSPFRRKHRHNFVPFGFSLPYDLQIVAILSLEHYTFWRFLGGSDILSVGFSS